MELPKRKRIRLENYDYSRSGAYFITICTKDRDPLLSTIGENASILLKPYGVVLDKYIRNVPEIEKYVIMPDHVHMLLYFAGCDMECDRVTSLGPSRVANIVRSIKTLTTKELGHPIFQRSYYDHVIRNQEDFNETWEYIENNPKNWLMKRQGWF